MVPRLKANNGLSLEEKMALLEKVSEFHDLSDNAKEVLKVAYSVPKLLVKFPFNEATGEKFGDDFYFLLALYELIGKCHVEIVGSIEIKLPGVDYHEYINSSEWKAKAEAAKERAGQRCQTCNTPRSQAVLDAHHRTYERLGDELDSDLVVLCRKCHDIFHENTKVTR